MVTGKKDIKISWKIKFKETSARFPFINELDWWNPSSHADSEGCRDLSLITYIFRHFPGTFLD